MEVKRIEDPEDLIRFCLLLEPTVGGINEHIRSPDCCYAVQRLRETLAIPVFHDDQHGTAIIFEATQPWRNRYMSCNAGQR